MVDIWVCFTTDQQFWIKIHFSEYCMGEFNKEW